MLPVNMTAVFYAFLHSSGLYTVTTADQVIYSVLYTLTFLRFKDHSEFQEINQSDDAAPLMHARHQHSSLQFCYN